MRRGLGSALLGYIPLLVACTGNEDGVCPGRLRRQGVRNTEPQPARVLVYAFFGAGG